MSRWFNASCAVAALAAVLGMISPTESCAQGPWAVYVMNADGSDVERVRYDQQSLFGSPCWLHDGKRVAYDGGQQGFDDSHIFVQKLGQEAKDIGTGNTPSFSPDDQQVAFFMTQSNSSGAKPGIYVMNADGANREWISEGSRPRWSPDGEKLVFASNHEGFPSVYVYDTVSLERTRVLPQGYDQVIGAAFSPDATQLVVIGYKGGEVRRSSTDAEGDVLVIAAKANSQPTVVCRSRVGWHPDWSPMGNKLLFRIHDNGVQRLHILDLDSEKAKAVAIPNQFGQRNSDGVWSPDGKRILFISDRG